MNAGLEPTDMFALGDALFAEAIIAVQARLARPVLVGLTGAQGSGKSTSARRLADRLERAGHRTAMLSLDDFYLTRAERGTLAGQIHPLLAVRGVPGTHDVALTTRTISALLSACDDSVTPIPVFDKATDDRVEEESWRLHQGRASVVLLEGWCVGARPQPESALADPVNALESGADADGRWRRYVNACLAGDYASLFAKLDLRLLLRAPSFSCVLNWRAEQEAGLDRSAPGSLEPMTEVQLAHFIEHYERVTCWLTDDEPSDLVADLDERRVPTRWRWKGELPGRN